MSEKSPKVFISYSWDTESHKQWVRQLAVDLRKNGVDVTLDQWHLKVADDIAAFMDQSINAADFILLICTQVFADKSNTRSGGVGYELGIIAGELLTGISTSGKFLPLLRSGPPSHSLPSYLRTRLFVDFRSDDQYEQSLVQLLRHLFNAPEYTPPEIGSRPVFDTVSKSLDLPPSQPSVWVVVAGTGRVKDLSEKQRETSALMGRLLAANGFGLVTGGWPGVDEIVARSFSQELTQRSYPLEDFLTQIVVEDDLPAFPSGNLIMVKKGRAEYIEEVERADAVIIIGGLGGAAETGRVGLEHGKAVFPLADTDGDAKPFYIHMLRKWEQIDIPNITKAQFQKVARSAPDVARDVISLLKLLHSTQG